MKRASGCAVCSPRSSAQPEAKGMPEMATLIEGVFALGTRRTAGNPAWREATPETTKPTENGWL